MSKNAANPLFRPGLTLLASVVAIGGLGLASYRLLTGAALAHGTPAFSSLRTDPSGSSVLFGAYAHAGLTVVRGFEPGSLVSMSPSTTVAFVLAPEAWNNHLSGQLLDFAQRGGLVVLAAPPMPGAVAVQEQPEVGLERRLNASLARTDTAGRTPTAAATAAAPAGVKNLPILDPRTVLRLSSAWSPLFQSGGRTYMAMRTVGKGRIILATEATFLSNDDLAHAPDVTLLSWFTIGRSTVWVDETLHNLQESRGIAWLLERYRLQTAVLWLLVTLGLLAWRVSASLERPPDASRGEGDEQIIESASAGYIRLLRRAIPPAQLLDFYQKQYALRHPRRPGTEPNP